MRNYYQDGFDNGYGRDHNGPREYPQNDGDDYSYRRGQEDGRRRRDIANELDREYWGE